ncbi:MAG: hypothetical protein ACK5O8_17835, partial [Pirellula sp.]
MHPRILLNLQGDEIDTDNRSEKCNCMMNGRRCRCDGKTTSSMSTSVTRKTYAPSERQRGTSLCRLRIKSRVTNAKVKC